MVPNRSETNATCPAILSFGIHLTWPFRITDSAFYRPVVLLDHII